MRTFRRWLGSLETSHRVAMIAALTTGACAVLAAIVGGVFVLLAASGPADSGAAASAGRSTPVSASAGPDGTGTVGPTAEASQTASTDPGTASTGPSSTPLGVTGPQLQYLQELDPVAGGFDTGTQKVDATVYPHSLSTRMYSGYSPRTVEYDLNRSWTGVRAVIGVSDESSADMTLQFEVFADGKRVGTVSRLSLGHHLDINADVTGALRLRLVVSYVSGTGHADGVWGDVRLTR